MRRRPFWRALATSGAQRVDLRRSKSRSAASMASWGTAAHGTLAARATSPSAAATSQPSCVHTPLCCEWILHTNPFYAADVPGLQCQCK